MAKSSYQTLARYNDCRQSNRMPDIRQRLRDDLYSSRSETRLSHLLRMRRLDHFGDDEDEFQEPHEVDSHYSHSTPDSYNSSFAWGGSTLPPSNAPSPSLSYDSDYCSSNVCNPTPTPVTCGTFDRPQHRAVRPKTRKQILETRKRVHRSFYDSEAIQRDYYTLKKQLIQSSNDSTTISFIVCSRWTVLSRAINDSNEALAKDALNLLTQIINYGLIKIPEVLFIMQQGLILVIKDALSRLGSQPTDVIALITSILVIEPRAAPFMIELMADTGILLVFDELIQYGVVDEVYSVCKFYQYLFGTTSDLVQMSDFRPVLPETISKSTPSAKLINLYSPALSLKRVIQPALLETFISRFFRQINRYSEELFRMAFVIVGHCLNFVSLSLGSSSPDLDWSRTIMYEFELANMDQLLIETMSISDTKHLSNNARQDIERFYQFYRCTSMNISKQLSRSI